MKYSHAKTCGIVKPPVEQLKDAQMSVFVPIKPRLDDDIRPVSDIKPRKTVAKAEVSDKPRALSPTKPTTLEEMRHNYYINAKQQHTHKIKLLFANAI